jgi:hypothetical protein
MQRIPIGRASSQGSCLHFCYCDESSLNALQTSQENVNVYFRKISGAFVRCTDNGWAIFRDQNVRFGIGISQTAICNNGRLRSSLSGKHQGIHKVVLLCDPQIVTSGSESREGFAERRGSDKQSPPREAQIRWVIAAPQNKTPLEGPACQDRPDFQI